jgi:DNA-binding transcriptional ArsR family regulator
MLETEYQAARLLSAVANSLRFRIVLELGRKPCTPTELAKKLKRSLPRVSYHLALLRRGDAVRFKAHGPRHQVIYWLKHPKVLQLCKDALECVHGIRQVER